MTGVPPLVSRRALETLTYLARNHPLVAKLLLEFRVHKELSSSDDKRGKAVMLVDEQMENPEGQASFTLLLSLLNQSLYLRSIAHLEQVTLCKQLKQFRLNLVCPLCLLYSLAFAAAELIGCCYR